MYINYVWSVKHRAHWVPRLSAKSQKLRHHLHKLTKVALQDIGRTRFKLQLLDSRVRLCPINMNTWIHPACLGSIMGEAFSRHTFGLLSCNLASFFFLTCQMAIYGRTRRPLITSICLNSIKHYVGWGWTGGCHRWWAAASASGTSVILVVPVWISLSLHLWHEDSGGSGGKRGRIGRSGS